MVVHLQRIKSAIKKHDNTGFRKPTESWLVNIRSKSCVDKNNEMIPTVSTVILPVTLWSKHRRKS